MAWENGKSDVVHWKKITEKTAALMLDQCQTLLKETTETAKTISLRTDKLIAIEVPIATTGAVYFIGNSQKGVFGFLD